MIFYEVNKHKYTDKYKNNASAKFSSLNQVLDNCYYKEELKETIFDIFFKSQKLDKKYISFYIRYYYLQIL